MASPEGTKREVRLANVRRLYLVEALEFAEKHKDYPDHIIVVLALLDVYGVSR